MNRLAHAVAIAGSLMIPALVGCNSVLGIDEAHPRDNTQTSTGLLEVPIASCDGPVPSSCRDCIDASCKNSIDTCLSTNACRDALNEYRKCLGPKCSDSSCLAALKAGPAADLANCALGSLECPQCPPATPLADICELYCSCMQQPMPPTAGADAEGLTCEQYDGSTLTDWPAGDHAACLAACRSLNETAAIHCRWTHCELAQSGELGLHCGHAVDESRCPLKVQTAAECKDRRIDGWGCKTAEQCCSNRCLDNICVPG